MSKNWSLILVVAFVLGLSVNTYLTKQAESDAQKAMDSTTAKTENTKSHPDPVTFHGKDKQAIDLFDITDTRTRIIYFGFTRCPDVCPTSLAMLAGAINELDEASKESIRPVFISLDPERDFAESAHQYAQYFHPMIEGLSAPLATTTELAHHYGVIFRKTELEGSELEYTIDHSSYFYFTAPDGTLLTKVPHTLSPAPLVDAITRIDIDKSHTQ
ncbi:SCO family protein [Vibrio sp. YMD68]|uniref:SCO family protein n=1 Tax=Vibrio sp. YMD68 TaxID=3042300 RepID=UPI00249BEF71|nr:SCO family protein [Vibrio sp. YMD68]WGV98476.1 SCO family protein [Vibrio sp. YMD68]